MLEKLHVEVGFIEQEKAEPLLETFNSFNDIHQDETVQTTITNIIESIDTKTVTLEGSVNITP